DGLPGRHVAQEGQFNDRAFGLVSTKQLQRSRAIFPKPQEALFLEGFNVVVGAFDRYREALRRLADSRRVGVAIDIRGDEVEHFLLTGRKRLHLSCSIPNFLILAWRPLGWIPDASAALTTL